MAQEKKRSIAFIGSRSRIGQTIYIPQKNKVVKSTILGYEARVGEEKGNLFAVISAYEIDNFVSVRKGHDSELTSIISAEDFYNDKEEAQEASRFLELRLDEEAWKIAVGEREIVDQDSQYSLENCNLPPCCENVSEARDILLYSKRNNGLIVHYRNELTRLLFKEHDFEYDAKSPIGRIFEQLQVKRDLKK